ncbi:MAG: hypothetical protein ACSW8F_03405, partial [bacterium]
MNENTPKKRGWVKDVAIVFLLILLVLTFFSKTIMDWSLPEVAVQTVTNGSITAQIRGSVTVKAAETYELKVPDGKRVISTLVKTGDAVSRGDTLLILSDEAGAELTEAQTALKNAQRAYQQLLLSGGTTDASRAVTDARAALAEAQKKLAEKDVHAEKIAAAEQVVEEKKAALEARKAEVDKAQEGIDAVNETIKTCNAEIRAVEKLLKNYLPGTETLSEDTIADLRDLLAEGSDEVKEAALKLEFLAPRYQKYYDDILEEAAKQIRWTDGYQALEEDPEAQKTYIEDRLFLYVEDVLAQIEEGRNDLIVDWYTLIYDDEWGYIHPPVPELQQEYKEGYATYKAALDAYDEAVKKYERVNGTAFTDFIARCEKALAALAEAQENLTAAQEKKTAAEAEVPKAEGEVTEAEAKVTELKNTDFSALEKSIVQLKRNVTDAERAYQLASYNNTNSLSDALAEVERCEALVEKYAGLDGGTELTAEVDGIVKAINVPVSGTTSGSSLTIEVPDRGYTGELSVTTEQSQRVNVGDMATVSTGWWRSQDISARLAAIKTDPQNPRTNRLLVFTLTGADVESGSSLSISIGERSRNYDTVIPKSALRSDTNGSYVLLVTAKPSPVGNRYTATRMDVT